MSSTLPLRIPTSHVCININQYLQLICVWMNACEQAWAYVRVWWVSLPLAFVYIWSRVLVLSSSRSNDMYPPPPRCFSLKRSVELSFSLAFPFSLVLSLLLALCQPCSRSVFSSFARFFSLLRALPLPFFFRLLSLAVWFAPTLQRTERDALCRCKGPFIYGVYFFVISSIWSMYLRNLNDLDKVLCVCVCVHVHVCVYIAISPAC